MFRTEVLLQRVFFRSSHSEPSGLLSETLARKCRFIYWKFQLWQVTPIYEYFYNCPLLTYFLVGFICLICFPLRYIPSPSLPFLTLYYITMLPAIILFHVFPLSSSFLYYPPYISVISTTLA